MTDEPETHQPPWMARMPTTESPLPPVTSSEIVSTLPELPAATTPATAPTDLLATRATTHGDIRDNAEFTFRLLTAMSTPSGLGTDTWNQLKPEMQLCLLMVQHKIGRILSGNFTEPDHWRDIAGYATLIERILTGDYP